MAHEVESAIQRNKPAWWDIDSAHVWDTEELGELRTLDALIMAGLKDWDVHKRQAYVLDDDGSPLPIEGYYGTVRRTDMARLGVVGEGYQPVQNEEGMLLLTNLVDDSNVVIESAMSLRGGKIVAIVARRPENILICGEDYIPYLTFTNRHDGSGSVTVFTGDTRVVCMNTLRYGLATAKNVHRVRHTAGATSRIEEAQEALQISFDYTKELAAMAEELAAQKISDDQARSYLRKIIPDPEDPKATTRAWTNREERRLEVMTVYRDEKNANIYRTKWGLLNAVAEHDQHVAGERRAAERRMEAILNRDGLDQSAFEVLLKN